MRVRSISPVLLLVLSWLVVPPPDHARAAAVDRESTPPRVQASPSLAQAVVPAPGRTVRPIAPDLVAPPDIDSGGLRRVDPRAPLSEVGPAGPVRQRRSNALPGTGGERADVPAKSPAPLLFRPLASAAGRLEANGVVVAISGIEIVEPQRMCPRRDGGQWPCGTAARTAFRALLRNRAVDCGILPDDTRTTLSAACWLGGINLGAWLVENGWAKAATDGPFAEEQEKAVAAARGIFGPGPEPVPANGDFLPPSQLPSTAPLLDDGASPILDSDD